MKTALLFLALFGAPATFACSPPIDNFGTDKKIIEAILASPDLYTNLKAVGATGITSIQHQSGRYIVTADNGCLTFVTAIFKDSFIIGMCQSFEGVKVDPATCPK